MMNDHRLTALHDASTTKGPLAGLGEGGARGRGTARASVEGPAPSRDAARPGPGKKGSFGHVLHAELAVADEAHRAREADEAHGADAEEHERSAPTSDKTDDGALAIAVAIATPAASPPVAQSKLVASIELAVGRDTQATSALAAGDGAATAAEVDEATQLLAGARGGAEAIAASDARAQGRTAMEADRASALRLGSADAKVLEAAPSAVRGTGYGVTSSAGMANREALREADAASTAPALPLAPAADAASPAPALAPAGDRAALASALAPAGDRAALASALPPTPAEDDRAAAASAVPLAPAGDRAAAASALPLAPLEDGAAGAVAALRLAPAAEDVAAAASVPPTSPGTSALAAVTDNAVASPPPIGGAPLAARSRSEGASGPSRSDAGPRRATSREGGPKGADGGAAGRSRPAPSMDALAYAAQAPSIVEAPSASAGTEATAAVAARPEAREATPTGGASQDNGASPAARAAELVETASAPLPEPLPVGGANPEAGSPILGDGGPTANVSRSPARSGGRAASVAEGGATGAAKERVRAAEGVADRRALARGIDAAIDLGDAGRVQVHAGQKELRVDIRLDADVAHTARTLADHARDLSLELRTDTRDARVTVTGPSTYERASSDERSQGRAGGGESSARREPDDRDRQRARDEAPAPLNSSGSARASRRARFVL